MAWFTNNLAFVKAIAANQRLHTHVISLNSAASETVATVWKRSHQARIVTTYE